MNPFTTAIALACFSLSLVGCATTLMEKPGAAPGDFERDKYACEVQLGYVGHAGGMQPTDQLADYIVRGKAEILRCLKMKGWTEQASRK